MKLPKFFKRKQPKLSRYIERMAGQDYIDSTRAYLDYLEEHLNNVAKAFSELSEASGGKGEPWVNDDYSWHLLREEVINHDLSKFSPEEFMQYRANFFPVSDKDKAQSGFEAAWEHHKRHNHHHHETAENFFDVIRMMVDWIAMSYKFGDNPRDFYNKTKPSMKLSEDMHEFIERHFDYLEAYRGG